ncbi:MAG TPA: deoxyribodipyrimidine photo-lyase [Gaiellaceae bacterium]|nr:deoxyribodipyrimidine photo-lyase [Gaiellaceae bacterium]
MSRHSDGRTAVVLFTRDLRVHDHPCLVEAARSCEYVVPLFVLDDDVLDRAGPNRLAFLVEALGDLRESVRRRGADLMIRRGDPVAETVWLCRDVGADTVFVGEDVSPYARRREQRLATACQSVGIELRVEAGTTVVQPDAVAPDGGDHYRVFTPYWRRWREAPHRRPLSAPAQLRLPRGVAASELPLLRELNGRPASPGVARGGESEGRRRLTRWLADGLPSYAERRDRLDVDGTSRLSAYLHFGCLSPLEVVTRAQEHPDSDEFVRQLCWRDFFHQLLAGNPETTHRDLHPGTDDRRPDHDALERWRGGFTGYPIVDAGMRQLAFEGWLPNRARLIVGSFLTRNLGVDWRSGAAVFFDLLVDGDVASNAGNWQWVAGTGANTRRNRVLSPLAQARRFDPDGAYVRRWVPELRALPGPMVHEPWKAADSLLAPEYPAPIVEPPSPPQSTRRTHAGRA